MVLKNVSIKELEDLVQKSAKPVFAKFATEWCGVCKLNAPIVDKIAKEFGDQIVFVELDADKQQAWEEDDNRKYGIKLVPTYFLFKDQKRLWTKNNFVGEPVLREVVQKALAG